MHVGKFQNMLWESTCLYYYHYGKRRRGEERTLTGNPSSLLQFLWRLNYPGVSQRLPIVLYLFAATSPHSQHPRHLAAEQCTSSQDHQHPCLPLPSCSPSFHHPIFVFLLPPPSSLPPSDQHHTPAFSLPAQPSPPNGISLPAAVINSQLYLAPDVLAPTSLLECLDQQLPSYACVAGLGGSFLVLVLNNYLRWWGKDQLWTLCANL